MKNEIEKIAMKIIKAIGSVYSLIVHTIVFILFFILILIGYNAEKIMLILTTLVSLEAIYLSLFIQISVNKNTESIANIEEDVAEVQEDIEEIAEDVEEIAEDVEGINDDIGEINEDIEELQEDMEEISEEIIDDNKNNN
jgi:hypothetical protein